MDNGNQTLALVSLQRQVNSIRDEITGLNTGLTSIGLLIRNDTAADQYRLREEENLERKLVQAEIKVGKEKEIEQRITNSLSIPLKKAETDYNNLFSRIKASINGMLIGAISLVSFTGIKTFSEDLIKTISKGKNFVGDILKSITSGISFIGTGFSNIFKSISKVTGKITELASKLAKSPLEAVSKGFSGLFGAAGAGAAAVGSGVASTASNVTQGSLQALGNVLKGSAVPAIATGVDIATGEEPGRAVAGGFGGGLTSFAASNFGRLLKFNPLANLALSAGGYFLGSNLGKDIYDQKNLGQSFQIPNITKDLNLGNFDINLQNTFNTVSGGFDQFRKMVFGQEQKPRQVNAPITPTAPTPQPKPAEVQPIKPQTPPSNLSAPEKKPDIIYTSTIEQQQSQQSPPQSSSSEKVPNILSSNPDNFYVLYSQLSYNVVV